MNAIEATTAMLLGEVIKQEWDLWTEYMFDAKPNDWAWLKGIDDPFDCYEFKAKKLILWNNYQYYEEPSNLTDGPVQRRTNQIWTRTVTQPSDERWHLCTQLENQMIRRIWNWQYEGTPDATNEWEALK